MILDLFAGPGGWDVGLALLGLDAVGVEFDKHVCATRAQAGLRTIRADVSELDPARFGRVEGLIASPPCKDWSRAGTLTKRDGHTGWLVDEPERYVEALRPTWVAQEQVVGALEVWEEQARFYRTLGYRTWTGLLKAERYGVPQTRTRAILMAHLEQPVLPPEPTHQEYEFGKPAEEQIGLFGTTRPWVSMADALGWEDGRRVGFPRRDDLGTSDDGYRDRDWRQGDEPAFTMTEKVRSWVIDTRCDPDRKGQTQIRPIDSPAPTVTRISGMQWMVIPEDQVGENRQKGRVYPEQEEEMFPDMKDPHLTMKGSWRVRPTARSVNEPAQTLMFGHNAAGWMWHDGRPKTGGDRDAYVAARDEETPDWTKRRPATTIMGDHRVFSPGGHMANDGRNNEVMVRRSGEAIKIEPWEAAILQSFPANYPFAGARTRQFAQIGDAVPPFLAAAVLGQLTGRPWQGIIERLLYPEEFPTEGGTE